MDTWCSSLEEPGQIVATIGLEVFVCILYAGPAFPPFVRYVLKMLCLYSVLIY